MAFEPVIADSGFYLQRNGKLCGIFHFVFKESKHLFCAVSVRFYKQLIVNLKQKSSIESAFTELFIDVDHSDLDDIGKDDSNDRINLQYCA